MKNSIKLFIVGVLAAIYCLAIGIFTNSLTHTDFKNNSGTSQVQYFSDVTTNLFYHTSENESSVNNHNNHPVQIFKIPFNVLWGSTTKTEQLFESAFSQYINFSRNFLILHRKSDIIFPFHYFW